MEDERVTVVKTFLGLTERQYNRILWFGSIFLFMALYFRGESKKEKIASDTINRLVDDKKEDKKTIDFLTNTILKMADDQTKYFEQHAAERDTVNVVLKKAVEKLTK